MLPAVCIAAAVLVVVAVAVARLGGGEVSVAHLGRPDGPAGTLPSGDARATPFSLSRSAPSASEVARLRVEPTGGGSRTLGELRGPRATVLAFFASYCIPCRTELPLLQSRAQALDRQGVRLLLVDFNEDATTATAYLHDRGVRLPGFVDPGGGTHDALGLIDVPSTVVLGEQGQVVDRLEGFPDSSELDRALRAMGLSPQ